MNNLITVEVNLDISDEQLKAIKSDWQKLSELPVLILLQGATHKFEPIGWYGEFTNQDELSDLYERDYVHGYTFESHGIKFYGMTAEKDYSGEAEKLNHKVISEYKDGKCIIKLK